MADEIINRVANSALITVDLEDWYPKGERVFFDIAPWLFGGLVLKENDFREKVDTYQWTQHQGHYVALGCSADAIIPSWAYLLVTIRLQPYAKKIIVGDLALLENLIYQEILLGIDISIYKDKPVIIKGCSNKPVPLSAYTMLLQFLQPHVRSIMFGEACSNVPLYKSKK